MVLSMRNSEFLNLEFVAGYTLRRSLGWVSFACIKQICYFISPI